MAKRIKTAYLVGPIEFSANPDSDWRYLVEELLKPLRIRCINPVKVSYLVGKDIRDNAKYACRLKRVKNWRKFRAFMKKIWGQDKSSVDASGVLICWVRNKKEARELNASGGTYREYIRGQRKKKRLFLVYEVGTENINSHLLDIILSQGAIFEKISDLVECFRHYNKTGKWRFVIKKRRTR